MVKKLSVVGDYGTLYYTTKIHNQALVQRGMKENPKKNIRKQRIKASIKAEKDLQIFRENKIRLLREYGDLLDRPVSEDVYRPQIDIQDTLTIEDRLYRKLLENRDRYNDEIRIHGEQTLIKEGFVYIIENCSYSGWVKVGMAFDYEKRLSVYNQYDPEKRYSVVGLRWTPDRRVMEARILDEMSKHATKQNGEWFMIDTDYSLKIFYSVNE